MTLVRLSSGGLWLHSPVQPNSDVQTFIETLGPVRYVVAPNLMHYLFFRDYSAVYPAAEFFFAPGLQEKRPEFAIGTPLTDEVPEEWKTDFEFLLVRGMPKLNEAVFFHKPSRSLIVSDLVFNLERPQGLLSRFFYSMNRMGDGMKPTRFFVSLIRDRKAFRESVTQILEWRPDRVIMSHGSVVERDADRNLKRAFRGFL